jgi:nitroreductase
MTLFEAITERYSFRGEYKNTPIPRTDLQKILEAGLAAPSGCNSQTAYLIGIDKPELIKEAAKILENEKLAAVPGICVITHVIPAFANTYFNIQDYSAAIENMLLAISALGYASCWIEGVITTDKKRQTAFAKLLDIPDGMDLVAYLPVGVPAAAGQRASHKPFGERAFFNGFGKN